MTQDAHTPPSAPQPRTTGTISFSGRYAAVVGVLLLMIITTLAALWMRERQRRVAAETREAQVRANMERMKADIAGIVQQMMMGQETGEAGIPPFRREDQVPVTVTVDGEKKSAYRLSAEGAKRFGFQPGDVILVSESRGAPTTRTTTVPATATAPSH